jgi:3-oxoacyl-[acyl-carrier-protein] synthase II
MSQSLSPNLSAPKRHFPHRLTSFLQQKYGVPTSRCGTSFSACAAAAQAIVEGMRCLRRDEAQVAFVGGHDSMDHPMGLLSFDVLGALSSDQCRPFDIHRNGFMLGEGATILILETKKHAEKRGVSPIAKIVGAGTSVDAHKATAPHPQGQGAYLSMSRALNDSSLSPLDIGYVNAHGTGTPLGDVAESKAIAKLFGKNQPTSSIKGAIGHTVAAAGAMEAVACILSLQQGFIPGTVGFEQQDPSCPVDVITHVRQITNTTYQYSLSNSFGFGGQNCSLIFGTT